MALRRLLPVDTGVREGCSVACGGERVREGGVGAMKGVPDVEREGVEDVASSVFVEVRDQ